MKSRIMKPSAEKILIYGFSGDMEEKFRILSGKLNISLEIIPKEGALEQIGYLAGFSGFLPSEKELVREESCVIFSCIDSRRLDGVLRLMREYGLGGIPLKAAVTAYNQKMTLSELIDELKSEHNKLHPNE